MGAPVGKDYIQVAEAVDKSYIQVAEAVDKGYIQVSEVVGKGYIPVEEVVGTDYTVGVAGSHLLLALVDMMMDYRKGCRVEVSVADFV